MVLSGIYGWLFIDFNTRYMPILQGLNEWMNDGNGGGGRKNCIELLWLMTHWLTTNNIPVVMHFDADADDDDDNYDVFYCELIHWH